MIVLATMVANTESDLLQLGNPLGHKTIHFRRKPL
jgi:hypothetical protein